MNILFRADSSSTIGTGHIMRDLVLASEYRNKHIIFATQALKGNINHKITEAGYQLEILDSNDVLEVDTLIKKYAIEMIIIDHYGIDYNFEKQLAIFNPQLLMMVFDDVYKKHHCHVILNHNIYADKNRYKGLVPQDCECRCGLKYTLLRDEFKREIDKQYTKNDKFTFFIAMGGADHSNINRDILEVLAEFKNIEINLVTTTANANLDMLLKYVEGKAWIKLHINSNKIAKLMKQSDFAIVTPSVTVNEVVFMGLPFLAIMTADNQVEMFRYLKNNNGLLMNKYSNKKLSIILEGVINE